MPLTIGKNNEKLTINYEPSGIRLLSTANIDDLRRAKQKVRGFIDTRKKYDGEVEVELSSRFFRSPRPNTNVDTAQKSVSQGEHYILENASKPGHVRVTIEPNGWVKLKKVKFSNRHISSISSFLKTQ